MIGKHLAILKDTPTQRNFLIKAAAHYLGISPNTLRKRTDAGEIPCYQEGHQRVWRLEDLDRYIESRPAWKVESQKSPRRKQASKA